MDRTRETELRILHGLTEAQSSGFPGGYLLKGPNAEVNVINIAGAFDEISVLGRRAIYHCNRLLTPGRSIVERNFALALAYQTGKSIDSEESWKVSRIVSGQGHDSCLWWTLSPYIYKELADVDKGKAVKVLFDWAKSGKVYPDNQYERVNLTGLEIYNRARDITFTLSEDPMGQSHRFAESEAKRLLEEVFLRR